LVNRFFQVKKGDEFALTFTERFINDTIYDGVDSLKLPFEYKGKEFMLFRLRQIQTLKK
jgi:hypothetical protein